MADINPYFSFSGWGYGDDSTIIPKNLANSLTIDSDGNLLADGKSIGSVAAGSVLDGMEVDGDKLIISYHTEDDSSTQTVEVDLSKFVDVYTGGEGISVDGYKISIDDDEVATQAELDAVQTQIDTLSQTVTDSIDTINTDIEEEKQARADADTALQTQITELEEKIPTDYVKDVELTTTDNNTFTLVVDDVEKGGFTLPSTDEFATQEELQEVKESIPDVSGFVKSVALDADDNNNYTLKVDDEDAGSFSLAEYATKDELSNKVDWTDISTEDNPNRKCITLANHDNLEGYGTEESGPYNLAMVSKWNVADFGSSQIHLNLNSPDTPTLNDDEKIALISDIPDYINAPVADEADFLLGVKDGQFVRYFNLSTDSHHIAYEIVNGSAESKVYIDEEEVSIAAEETIHGICTDLDFTQVDSVYHNYANITIIGNIDGSKINTNDSDNVTTFPELTSFSLTGNTTSTHSYYHLMHGAPNLKSISLKGIKPTTIQGVCRNCTSLTDVSFEDVDLSMCSEAAQMFMGCTSIENIDLSMLNVSNCNKLGNNLNGTTSLKTANLSNWHPISVQNVNAFFYNSGVEEINFGDNWDLTNCTNINNFLYGCTNLTTVTGEMYNIKLDLDLSAAPLTETSALIFINGLYDYSHDGVEHTEGAHTITVSSTTYEALSDDDKAIITDKGWTLSY